jgi:hypothetical protein
MNTGGGIWLSLNDYCHYKAISVSSVRRHIKKNILKFKEEGGKYFIYVPSKEKLDLREQEASLKMRLENEYLKQQIRSLKEENAELRMLNDLYENQKNIKKIYDDNPPEFPLGLI